MGKWLVSVGDAFSQLVGRFIFFRNDGIWQAWTLSPNESISGASYRWYINGGPSWPKKLIDALLFIDPDHCEQSYYADYRRARAYIKEVEDL